MYSLFSYSPPAIWTLYNLIIKAVVSKNLAITFTILKNPLSYRSVAVVHKIETSEEIVYQFKNVAISESR